MLLIASAALATPPAFSTPRDAAVLELSTGAVHDGSVGPMAEARAIVNNGLFGAGVQVTHGGSTDPTTTIHPSAGLKLKILGTPDNLGYTWLHLGFTGWGEGATARQPALGLRDVITFGQGRRTGYLPWEVLVSHPLAGDLDAAGWLARFGGGVAFLEEHPRDNIAGAVVLEARRVPDQDPSFAVLLTVSHQLLARRPMRPPSEEASSK